MSRLEYLLLVLLLGALIALPPFSIDTSLPAMPAMADALAASPGRVQLTLSAYVLGSAVGQIMIGPLSDRFGRRPALFAGLVLYAAASLGCAGADSVGMLTLFRFVQGIATATGRILPRAMARDLFDREEAARLLSYMMVFGGLAPILAPILGGQLLAIFGWPAVFAFMAAYATLLLLLTALFLTETRPPAARRRLHVRTMARDFARVVRNRTFLGYAACICSAVGGLFAYLTGSSTALIRFLGETPQAYGFDLAIVMVGTITFNIIGGQLVARVGIDRLLAAGTMLAAAAGLVMAGLAFAGFARVAAIVAPMFFFMAAFALIMAPATAGALSPFPEMAGTAASFLGFLQTSFAAAVSATVGLLDDGTQVPMTTTIAVMGLGALAAYLALVRPRLRRAAGGHPGG